MKMANEHKSTLLEQKLLRLQMNPHFIFNAFSNILKFIDNNENSKASNYLTTFSKLLRTTLESTREDLVPFERERGTLENYLELQKLRYPNKFSYAIEIDQAIDEEEMSIPPMLVQPFIENSIEHGIRHKKGKGHIDVRFILDGKKIVCEVEDDGIGRKKAWEAEVSERSDRKPLATNIVQDRINVLNRKFKQKISLDIIDKPVGTLVRLDLPYLYII
jgi:LytS/YehU family sensor histidine kinase